MQRKSIVVKLISILLTVGGATGIGVFVWALSRVQVPFSKETLAGSAFVVVFGWATWTGVDLWRNNTRAYKSAIVLFALQIPNFTISKFAYEFYTGLLMLLSFGPAVNVGFEFRVASGIRFEIFREAQDAVVGINLVAVAALIWLIRVLGAQHGSPQARRASQANEHEIVSKS